MRVIGLVGWSGAGKTTLLTRLLPLLTARGLTVSTIKHAHHGFDVDQPGKDSYEHRSAGAREVLVSSARRTALIQERREGEAEPGLADLLARLSPADLVIVEGFKREAHPKIEVFRAANGKPPLFPTLAQVRAIASDVPLADTSVPVVPLDDLAAVAEAVLRGAEPIDALRSALIGGVPGSWPRTG